MTDSIKIWLEDERSTRSCAASLAHTLYRTPVNVLLEGDLGGGKTTFVQALCEELGITEPVTSPTFALEQIYETADGTPFTHIDLYRIPEQDVQSFLEQSGDHKGIRCIEWASRGSFEDRDDCITVRLDDASSASGRNARVTFRDALLPSPDDIDRWRTDVRLPDHIVRHCDKVAEVAVLCADHLIKHGIVVRRSALESAARLHDLLRFVDFNGSQSHLFPTDPDNERFWAEQKKAYPDMRHERACASFLRKKGFATIADIVEPHGAMLPSPPRTKAEQLLLYYADKRVKFEEVVTIQERFDDFKKRYANGENTPEAKAMLREALKVEEQLFKGKPPL